MHSAPSTHLGNAIWFSQARWVTQMARAFRPRCIEWAETINPEQQSWSGAAVSRSTCPGPAAARGADARASIHPPLASATTATAKDRPPSGGNSINVRSKTRNFFAHTRQNRVAEHRDADYSDN